MSGAARKAAKLANGGGYNKMIMGVGDDLPSMYPETSSPLTMHATGVNPDSEDASVFVTGVANKKQDLEMTPWESRESEVPAGSEMGMINPHKYLMDTVYKPMGLEAEAAKRLKMNPYFRPPAEDESDWAELLIHNSDDAGRAGRGGYATGPARRGDVAFRNPRPNMGVGAFNDDPTLVSRHEARHLITNPYVFNEPADPSVSDAIARAQAARPVRKVDKGEPPEIQGQVLSNAEDSDLLRRQNLESLHEMVAHLGDAHDYWVRTQGRMVDNQADAKAALEAWAARPYEDVRVDSKVKREVLLDAFNNGGNDVISRILRHMYAVPVAAGVAGSQQQQQQSPLRGLNQ